MVVLTYLVFFCIQIATGYNEEIPDRKGVPSIDNSARQQWPVPIYYHEPQVYRRKPCSHRRSNAQTSGQWAPLFSQVVTKPVANNILEPQALKNENVEDVADNTKTSENPTKDELPLDYVSSTATTTTTSKHEDRSVLENHNRRSNDDEQPNDNEDQHFSEQIDCDIDLNTKDYYDSQYGREELSNVALTAGTDGVDRKVIEMLRDCMNIKQKLKSDQSNQEDEIPIAGSRRSMGGSDDSKSDDDKQANTDTDEAVANTELSSKDHNDSVPDNLHETSVTQRSGRLLNELQNPIKTTGIANASFTRRMPADRSKVCYACSTVTNPSCWEPGNRTTIKYCRADQNCVTKHFGVRNTQTILRDCATSCEATSVPGIEPKYTSCSVCYTDYCNSASTSHYSLAIIFLLTSVKYAF